MTANIIYDGVRRAGNTGNETESANTLFSGQKLWFSHTVPARKWLMENAKINGAVIVKLDKDADVILVDHAKKENAPGTYSYKYVEYSIRNGRLEDLAQHAVGIAARVSRPVGSTSTAPKSRRTPFTQADDQVLWDWVKPYEENGGTSKGNEIYKQLESANPRHTYQSWRDRWIKIVRYQKRTTTLPNIQHQPRRQAPPAQSTNSSPQRKRRRQDTEDAEPPAIEEPTSHINPSPTKRRPAMRRAKEATPERIPREFSFSKTEEVVRNHHLHGPSSHQKRRTTIVQKEGQATVDAETETESDLSEIPRQSSGPHPFTTEEFKQLYHLVPKLTNVSAENFKEAWNVLASSEDWTGHTPKEWKLFYETKVIPEFCRRHKLTIEKVAPYLVQEDNSGTRTPKRKAKDEPNVIPEVQTTVTVCDNCFISQTSQWRSDKRGKPLCNECAIFLRTHGVPRPPTTWVNSDVGQQDDKISNIATTARTPQANVSIPPVPTPASNYVNRATSPIIAKEYVQHLSPGSPGPSRLKSPSFQPESPTLSRPPEPNEARKRSAGRNGSQSQTTSQESNKSISQTQNLDTVVESAEGGHDLLESPRLTKGHEVTMDHALKSHTIVIPPFQLSTKGKRNRHRLQDETGNLDFPTQSSMRSDQAPPRNPPSFDLMESIEGGLPQASKDTRRRQNLQRTQSPLFVPEDADEDGNESLGEAQSRASVDLEEQLKEKTSSLNVNLVSDSSVIPARDCSLSAGPSTLRHRLRHEGRTTLGRFTSSTLASQDLQPRRRMERFETAPETIDEFETAAEGQSVPNSHLNKGRERRLSTQALFQRAGNDQDEFFPDLELPEPEGGWDQVLGNEAEEESDSRGQGLRSHHQSIDKGKGKALSKDEPFQDYSSLSYTRVPSREITVEPDALSAANAVQSDEPETSRWLTSEEAKQANIHRQILRPILFAALEATIFDFDLASEVVAIVLKQLPVKYRRRHPVMHNVETQLPQNMRGVWTDEDDNLLMSSDARDLRRVQTKHGLRACDNRFEFLGYSVES